jgi:hypothetical protein
MSEYNAFSIMEEDSKDSPSTLKAEELVAILSRYPGATVSVGAYSGMGALILEKAANVAEDSDSVQINLITDEQYKRFLRVASEADVYPADATVIKTILLALLNKDRILGYR